MAPTTPQQEMLGTVLADRYELTEVIGEGGMGTVFRAHQLGVGRDVAIKILNPVPIQDYDHVASLFFREARAICQLTHPNTIRLFDFGRTSEDQLYITMELVRGKPLSQLIKDGAFQLKDAIHIGKQVAEALLEAHDQGIIHRDIKPDNVLVENKVWDSHFSKMLDFGIARIIGQSSDSKNSPLRFGTPLYMSPEQILGNPSDARTDIYMLGALLFECLTGRPPYLAQTAVDVCLKHLEAPIPPLVRWNSPWMYPPRLVTLVQSMLAKKPEDRPASVLEVARELGQISTSEDTGERTAIIPSASAQDLALHNPESLPFEINDLSMSHSFELTDELRDRVERNPARLNDKAAIREDLSMTPRERDPRDLITRISTMHLANQAKADAPVDPFNIQKPKISDTARTIEEKKREVSQPPRGASAADGDENLPTWLIPTAIILGVVLVFLLTLVLKN